MYVEWAKQADGEWFELDTAPLSTLHVAGVYVIWAPSSIRSRPGTVLKVGSGNIAVRLAYERADPLLYLATRPPLVTWAEAEDRHHLGLVRYLAQFLRPVLNDPALSEGEPIPVNLPLRA